MPDDETASHYFDLYFTHVHPYVPVLSRALFYQQWNTDRDNMSPLVLEAVFAVGGRLADDPALGQQWLALASSTLIQRPPPSFPLSDDCKRWADLCYHDRTRRFVYGRPATKHAASAPHHAEGEGSSAQAWLLLPIVDVRCAVCADGQGPWVGRTLRGSSGRAVL